MRTLTAILCALIFISPVSGQKTKLSLNLNQGESYKQISHSKVTINQDVYGMKMDIVLDMDASMSFLVKAVSDEGYDLEVTYDWMKMKMELPQTTMDFSSEKNDENDLFSSILGEMKGQVLKMKMSRLGRVTDIEDVEGKWDAIIDGFDQFSEQEREQVKTQLMNSYGGKAISGSIESYTAIFPDKKKVKKGAEWTIETKTDAGMPFSASNTYTLESIESDFVILSCVSSVKSSEPDKYIETNGMMLKYNLAGESTSTLKVDKESGWIREAKIEQSIKGTSRIQANEQIPDGMSIPMTIVSATEISSE